MSRVSTKRLQKVMTDPFDVPTQNEVKAVGEYFKKLGLNVNGDYFSCDDKFLIVSCPLDASPSWCDHTMTLEDSDIDKFVSVFEMTEEQFRKKYGIGMDNTAVFQSIVNPLDYQTVTINIEGKGEEFLLPGCGSYITGERVAYIDCEWEASVGQIPNIDNAAPDFVDTIIQPPNIEDSVGTLEEIQDDEEFDDPRHTARLRFLNPKDTFTYHDAKGDYDDFESMMCALEATAGIRSIGNNHWFYVKHTKVEGKIARYVVEKLASNGYHRSSGFSRKLNDNEYAAEQRKWETTSSLKNRLIAGETVPRYITYTEKEIHDLLLKTHVYLEEVFIPYPLSWLDTRRINTFYGFPYKVLPNYECIVTEKGNAEKQTSRYSCDPTIGLFMDHFHMLVECNDNYLEWFLNFIAKKVQYPHLKTDVAMLLSSTTGTGKGILAKIISKLFGEFVIRMINHINQITGEKNGSLQNILGIIGDEVQGFGENAEKLKNIISEDKIEIRRLYEEYATVDNFLFAIFFTNKWEYFKIDDNDRRFACFKCVPKYKEDYDHSTKILAMLEDDNVMNSLFTFFMKRDISSFVIQDYPKTKLLELMKGKSADPIDVWIAESISQLQFSTFNRNNIGNNVKYKLVLKFAGFKEYKTLNDISGYKINSQQFKSSMESRDFVYAANRSTYTKEVSWVVSSEHDPSD